MNKWEVDLDGIRVGMVGQRKYVCFEAEAGTHSVRLVQTIGGTGWALAMQRGNPEVTAAVQVATGEVSGILCDAKIKAVSTHLTCKPVESPRLSVLKGKYKPEKK